MSEAEFDSYLSLLSKFLRLRSRHRAELADELRDHLESRLDELLAEGKTREQAAQVALEEFGDAAVLAAEFSRLASRRTRRFVMRCTAASAAVVAAVVLLSLSLAPPGPNGPGPEHAVAQPGLGAPAAAGGPVAGMPGMGIGAGAAPSIEQQAVALLDERLSRVVNDVNFDGVPLRAAIEGVADQIEADVLFDESALSDSDIKVDDPTSLKLSRTQVSARTVLAFLLHPKNLAFVNRAGVIYVTTGDLAGELLVTKVYNVRDLLANATTHADAGDSGWMKGSGMGMTPGGLGYPGAAGEGGAAQPSITDIAAALALSRATQLGGGMGVGGSDAGSGGMTRAMMGGMGGMGGGMGSPPPHLSGAAGELVETIRRVTPGPWIDTDGLGGTVTVFNGLLVVRQTEENHAEVQKLLDALREAGHRQPGTSVDVPKAGAAPAAGPTTPGQNASVPPNWGQLGLSVASLTAEERQSFWDRTIPNGSSELRAGQVLKVTEVKSNGFANAAGVKSGDVIWVVHSAGGDYLGLDIYRPDHDQFKLLKRMAEPVAAGPSAKSVTASSDKAIRR